MQAAKSSCVGHKLHTLGPEPSWRQYLVYFDALQQSLSDIPLDSVAAVHQGGSAWIFTASHTYTLAVDDRDCEPPSSPPAGGFTSKSGERERPMRGAPSSHSCRQRRATLSYQLVQEHGPTSWRTAGASPGFRRAANPFTLGQRVSDATGAATPCGPANPAGTATNFPPLR